MSTRGIVAVRENSVWAGFEIPADAYPDGIGAELVAVLRKLGFDEVCRRARSARLFPSMRERATQESHGTRGDLSWVYILENGRLRVFNEGAISSAELGLYGSWSEVATLVPDGGTWPELAVALPMPWPLLPVDETWDAEFGDADREATARLEARRRIAKRCEAESISRKPSTRHGCSVRSTGCELASFPIRAARRSSESACPHPKRRTGAC